MLEEDNDALLCETNEPWVYGRVLEAVMDVLQMGREDVQVDFEHGQWRVTQLSTGAQWSVVDCRSQSGEDYLDFEQVSLGEEPDLCPCEVCVEEREQD